MRENAGKMRTRITPNMDTFYIERLWEPKGGRYRILCHRFYRNTRNMMLEFSLHYLNHKFLLKTNILEISYACKFESTTQKSSQMPNLTSIKDEIF